MPALQSARTVTGRRGTRRVPASGGAVGEVFLFSSRGFGRRFQREAIFQCRQLGLQLTIVMPDPVGRMTEPRRILTRTTRPLRRLLEICRLRTRVWLVEDVNRQAFRSRVPDGCHAVIAGHGQIFKRPTIDRFTSFVNVHPSVLPYYRGPTPVQWCVANGETRSGYTLHVVTEEVDEGPVLRQGSVDISQTRNPTDAIIDAALPVFREWLQHVAGGGGFPVRKVDATEVYRIHQGYRSYAD
jgi:hypothetical protein